ncbi:MAG: Hint domain-containing protein [Xanthobacteraceae bacterium]
MNYTVTTNSDTGPGSLSEAITYANANPGTTITFGISNQTITLTSPLPLILGNNTTIDGGSNNITVSGANTYRVFVIGAAGQEPGTYPSTTATIENLTIANGNAQGGAGGPGGNGGGNPPGGGGGGGGGGAGLGGAIFVSSTGSLTLSGVALSSNAATGGDGGLLDATGVGGGGGMGGAGGNGAPNGGGGGGGFGNAATGGDGGAGSGGSGAFTDGGPAGTGGSGAGGSAGGGGGGGQAGQAAGGGGVAGTDGITGAGGTGGFGGGGGGGSGAGGFGGGGGGDTGVAGGGDGGFGSGGGGDYSAGVSGLAGFGGGHAGSGAGGNGGGGGGGGGLGGAVFVQSGGTLTISGTSTVSGNTANGGMAGPDGAAAGSGFGKGIFYQGSDGTASTLTIGAGNQTISNGIADYIGSGGTNPNGGTDAADQGGSLALDKTGGGTLTLSADNTYSGGTTVDAGSTLELAASGAAGSGPITLVGDPAIVIDAAALPAGGTLTNPIDGFAIGDTIDLVGLSFVFGDTSASIVDTNGTLQVTDGTNTDTLTLTGVAQTQQFTATDDGTSSHGTLIEDVPCYCRGTLIATERGAVPVEALTIGDRVSTRSGALRPIKWIGRRSYGGRFVMGRTDILPICIKAGALDDTVPRRDLWISPHHAMYLDGVLIEAKDLLNGVSIVQAERAEKVEYFHIELESHDVIIAEGALSESFIDDNDRGMFHNAREYRTLYPDAATAFTQYCAPRLSDGYEVETARRRINARAGLRAAADTPTLRGNVDKISCSQIAGWAQNVEHPEAPVCLDIYAGGRLIGQTLANRYRKDLERARLGSGNHSFAFTLRAGLTFSPDRVEVRRSLDGASLKLSPSCQANIARRERRAA